MPSQSTSNVGQRLTVLLAASLIGITSLILTQLHGDAQEARGRSRGSTYASPYLLFEKMDLPHGIHRDEFATNCLTCHSSHLVFSQPMFPKKKWGEIIHKMVSVYGAPINKDDEPMIVEYLMAVKGTR